MKTWIYGLEIDRELHVFELVYNRQSFFRDFLKFKENVFKNYQVPYLRYYKNGILKKESNFVSRQEFLDIVEQM